MIGSEQLHARILERMDMTREIEDEELTQLIYHVLKEASEEEYLSLDEKTILGRELFNAFRKLDLLQEFLEDETITEIMINGTQNIFYERNGRILQSGKRFLSKDKLEDVVQQIAAGSNRLVNEASPIVDARLQDGSRVNVVLDPIALDGPIVTIRKFSKEAITMEQLISWNSVSEEVLEFLAGLVAAGYNIFISGGTGSGKSSLVHLIPGFYPHTKGSIRIDGKELASYEPGELRNKVGIVMQKAVLFQGTIRDNLSWGRENATDEEMREALKTAQALEIVEKKEGLDTYVSQGGKNFSGGQRQRISIARHF